MEILWQVGLSGKRKAAELSDSQLDALAHAGTNQIHWHLVRGHAGHHGNERADALANLGVAALG